MAMSGLRKSMGSKVMKRYVVIGFDIRGHYVIGKVFEDTNAAKEYFHYLNNELVGKIIGGEHHHLEYAEMYEMDYDPMK